MPEALDNLIDRIKKEGVEKAEQESAQRLEKAETDASRIIADAEAKAADRVKQAEKAADQFEQRGRDALSHAARDTLLTLNKAIERVFDDLARRSMQDAMTREAWGNLIADLVKRYFESPEAQRDIHILVPKDEADTIADYLMSRLGEAAGKENGLQIGGDDDLTGGFRIELKDQHLTHDLSAEAIGQLLCTFLRPQLAELTRNALKAMAEPSNDTSQAAVNDV